MKDVLRVAALVILVGLLLLFGQQILNFIIDVVVRMFA